MCAELAKMVETADAGFEQRKFKDCRFFRLMSGFQRLRSIVINASTIGRQRKGAVDGSNNCEHAIAVLAASGTADTMLGSALAG